MHQRLLTRWSLSKHVLRMLVHLFHGAVLVRFDELSVLLVRAKQPVPPDECAAVVTVEVHVVEVMKSSSWQRGEA